MPEFDLRTNRERPRASGKVYTSCEDFAISLDCYIGCSLKGAQVCYDFPASAKSGIECAVTVESRDCEVCRNQREQPCSSRTGHNDFPAWLAGHGRGTCVSSETP